MSASPPCDPAARYEFGKVNLDSAILSAEGSQSFQSEASSFKSVVYHSSFETAAWSATCIPSDEVFNLVFSAYNSSSFVEYVVVSEDPATLFPMNVSEQMNTASLDACYYSNPCQSVSWAGYEAANFRSGFPDFSSFAQAYYFQPTVSYPPSGCADFYKCNLAVWVGLEDQLGAYPDLNLAQIGTTATCQYGGCSVLSYAGVYQFLSAGPPVTCTNFPVSGGDEFYVYMMNGALVGLDQTSYYGYMYDNQSGHSCSVGTTYSQMQTPIYAAFITENYPKQDFFGYPSLAEFTPVNFYGAKSYDQSTGSYYFIGDATNVWRDYMENCGTLNVDTSGIMWDPPNWPSGPGYFNTLWQSSQGTPYWTTGC